MEIQKHVYEAVTTTFKDKDGNLITVDKDTTQLSQQKKEKTSQIYPRIQIRRN